jgi:hypothetical protein
MTKELEALKRIRQETCPATYMQDFDKEECCNIIEQSLLELQAIKEANPSEALENLRICWAGNQDMGEYISSTEYEHIEQALLKAEKLEKAWEVILGIIKNEEYGTQEELLKACEDVYGKGSKEYGLLKEMTK